MCATRAEPAGGKIMLVLLVLAAIVNYTDRSIFSIAMPAIKADFAFTDSELGLLGGLSFGVFYGLAALPIGYLATRFSRRTLLAACLAVWSCATTLTSFAGGFATLFTARAVVGMGEAGGVPLSLSLIAARYRGAERPGATGWLTAGQYLGAVLGALATGKLIAMLGWRPAFLLLGAPGLLLALVLRLAVQEAASPAPGEKPALAEALALWRESGMRHLTVAFVASLLVHYGSQAWIPSFYARIFHLGSAQIGLLAGLLSLCAMTGALAGGTLARHAGSGRPGFGLFMAAIVSALSVPAGFAACYARNALLSETMMGVTQFAVGLRIAMLYTAQQDIAPAPVRPLVIAIVACVSVLIGSGLGPLLVGEISDHAAGGLPLGLAVAISLAGWSAYHCWRAGVWQRAQGAVD